MSSIIKWCNYTLNPIQDTRKGTSVNGYHCTKISSGCLNCYAEKFNFRFGNHFPYDMTHVTYELRISMLQKPCLIKKPSVFFWQSMSDLFHPLVPFHAIRSCFISMGLSPQHFHIILTKRPLKMFTVLHDLYLEKDFYHDHYFGTNNNTSMQFFPNVCLGISAENQQTLDKRLNTLLRCPSAFKFISFEPLLGRIDLDQAFYNCEFLPESEDLPINGIVVGPETGPKKRPCKISWVREIKDYCFEHNIPFTFKHWGSGKSKNLFIDGLIYNQFPQLILKNLVTA